MASRVLLAMAVLLTAILLISSEVSMARELAENTEENHVKKESVEEQKYPGGYSGGGGYPGGGGGYPGGGGGYPGGGGGYPGGGGGGYPGRGGGGGYPGGGGGYPGGGGGGYPGRGGGGYPGGGGGGYCRWGCCRRGYYGRCARCCNFAGQVVDPEYQGEP